MKELLKLNFTKKKKIEFKTKQLSNYGLYNFLGVFHETLPSSIPIMIIPLLLVFWWKIMIIALS